MFKASKPLLAADFPRHTRVSLIIPSIPAIPTRYSNDELLFTARTSSITPLHHTSLPSSLN